MLYKFTDCLCMALMWNYKNWEIWQNCFCFYYICHVRQYHNHSHHQIKDRINDNCILQSEDVPNPFSVWGSLKTGNTYFNCQHTIVDAVDYPTQWNWIHRWLFRTQSSPKPKDWAFYRRVSGIWQLRIGATMLWTAALTLLDYPNNQW